jgi:hypothetical protein
LIEIAMCWIPDAHKLDTGGRELITGVRDMALQERHVWNAALCTQGYAGGPGRRLPTLPAFPLAQEREANPVLARGKPKEPPIDNDAALGILAINAPPRDLGAKHKLIGSRSAGQAAHAYPPFFES